MAKIRVVNTRFWIDDYVSHLDPIEKLLFLYFLTNPHTDICGVYEVPLKNIALDTGIDKEMVIKILDRFEKDNKIFYTDGWVGVKNFIKHQSVNPSVTKGVEIGLTKAPKEILDKMKDRLGGGSDSLSHLNLNLNLNSNLNTKYNENGAKIIKAMEGLDAKNKTFYNNTTQREACDFLITEYGIDDVLRVIEYIKTNRGRNYTPSVTSPYELQQKWSKIGESIIRNKQGNKTKGFI